MYIQYTCIYSIHVYTVYIYIQYTYIHYTVYNLRRPKIVRVVDLYTVKSKTFRIRPIIIAVFPHKNFKGQQFQGGPYRVESLLDIVMFYLNLLRVL